jgi:hypothetical protein
VAVGQCVCGSVTVCDSAAAVCGSASGSSSLYFYKLHPEVFNMQMGHSTVQKLNIGTVNRAYHPRMRSLTGVTNSYGGYVMQLVRGNVFHVLRGHVFSVFSFVFFSRLCEKKFPV